MAGDHPYYDELLHLLEEPYLTSTDVRAQSGFRGDADRWERARRVITTPIRRAGSFLDIGCANGHLMETLPQWSATDGVAIEPYGLDLSRRLAAFARERLPHWAERIWAGNVMAWEPPRRFDYVRAELGYVPEEVRPDLIGRLLSEYTEDGGIAILCSYGSSRRPVYDIAALVRSFGYLVAGEAAAADLNGVVFTRVCWVGRP